MAAADTNQDGTVSTDELTADKQELTAAEAKAQAQVQAYNDNSGYSETPPSGSIDVSV